MKQELMSPDDAVNGLKHLADDHKCCAVFVDAVIDLIQTQQQMLVNVNRAWSSIDEALNTGDGTYKP